MTHIYWAGTVLALLFVTLLCTVRAEEYENIPCSGSVFEVRNAFPDTLPIGSTLFELQGLKNIVDDCASQDVIRKNGSRIILAKSLRSYCVAQIKCVYKCGTTGTGETSLTVIIPINRTGSHEMIFKHQNYTAVVQEFSAIDTPMPLNLPLTYTLRDCNGTGVANNRYFDLIVNAGGTFKWQSETNPDSLILNGSVSYDDKSEFTLEIYASQTEPVHANGTVKIYVSVIDVDNQKPNFTQASYTLSIPENNNSFVNVPLYTNPPVHAYDPDYGINASVIYSILTQDKMGLFTINETNGAIKVTEVLDRETTSTYTLIIQAQQTDKPKQTGTSTVNVQVVDVDDNKPMFNKDHYTATISEHAHKGAFVCKVEAVDKDEGKNANFTYHILTASIPLHIDNNGTITVEDSSQLDRECFENGTLIFMVGTTTFDNTAGENNTTVTVVLVDINDNNPVFLQKSYSYSFDTNTTQDSVIGQVNATDKDEGPNGNVTYTIHTETSSECVDTSQTNTFTVDIKSGDIKIGGDISCQKYKLFIQACDNPVVITQRRCSLATVTIAKSSAEETMSLSQDVSVLENSPPGTIISIIKCALAGRMYDYHGGDEFKVNVTGVLVTNILLDRENRSSYNISVDVKENTQTICRVNVTVHVADANDNAPKFTNSTMTFTLPDDVSDGEIVGNIEATDDDANENGIVRYFLQNTGQSMFSLNETSGELSVKSSDALSTDVMQIIVVARDNGSPYMKIMGPVYISRHGTTNSVSIGTPKTKAEIEAIKADIEKSLSDVLEVNVSIVHVTETVEKSTKSQIHIYTSEVSKADLLRRIVSNYEAVRSVLFETEKQSENAKLGVPEIGLIVMALVILIGAGLAMLIIHRQFNSHKRYKHLYDSLTAVTQASSLYESQEINVKMEDETSDYNGSVKSQDLTDLTEAATMGAAAITVNPIYQNLLLSPPATESASVNNDEIIVPEGQIPNTAVEEEDAMDSLNQLTDRLEREEEAPTATEDANSQSTEAVDVPIVQEENTPQVVYANVTLASNGMDNQEDEPVIENNDNNMTDEQENVFDAQNRTKNISPMLRRKNSESDQMNDYNEDIEEPNPDYDEKKVRFSTEVLDADKNILEPLKSKSDDKASIETSENIGNNVEEFEDQTNSINQTGEQLETNESDARDIDVQDNTGWLEEEINSPINTVTDNDNSEDIFFASEDAMTSL